MDKIKTYADYVRISDKQFELANKGWMLGGLHRLSSQERTECERLLKLLRDYENANPHLNFNV
jgi:hypothetical protein